MRLTVKYALIEVGYAPAERDVVVEELGELCGCGSGIRVAPGAERYEQFLVIAAEGHISVHHRGYADGCKLFNLTVILGDDVLAEICVAVLEPVPDAVHIVGPQTVHKLVLPLVAALRDRLVLSVDEHRLDSGGTELYAEYGLARYDSFFCCHLYGFEKELGRKHIPPVKLSLNNSIT